MTTHRIVAVQKPGSGDVTYRDAFERDVVGMEKMANFLGFETTVRMFHYSDDGHDYISAFQAARDKLDEELADERRQDQELAAASAISPDYSES